MEQERHVCNRLREEQIQRTEKAFFARAEIGGILKIENAKEKFLGFENEPSYLCLFFFQTDNFKIVTFYIELILTYLAKECCSLVARERSKLRLFLILAF